MRFVLVEGFHCGEQDDFADGVIAGEQHPLSNENLTHARDYAIRYSPRSILIFSQLFTALGAKLGMFLQIDIQAVIGSRPRQAELGELTVRFPFLQIRYGEGF